MTSLAAPLKRYSTLLLALLVTAVVALTMLVAAPKAEAAYKWHCMPTSTTVHRGDHDHAKCVHGRHKHSGYVTTTQREVHRVGRKHHRHNVVVHRTYQLGTFRTDSLGSAVVRFRIPTRLHAGQWHTIAFHSGNLPPATVRVFVRR